MGKAFKPNTIAQLNDKLNRTTNPVTRAVLRQIIDKRMDALLTRLNDKETYSWVIK